MLAVLAALACQLAEPGSIDVDGMLDDWEGVKPVRANGKDKDQSFDVRCLTDGTRLAIAIDVRDDELIRFAQATAKKQAGEDRVTLQLQAGGAPLQLALFPGTEKIAPRRSPSTTPTTSARRAPRRSSRRSRCRSGTSRSSSTASCARRASRSRTS